ncbi:MAG: RNA polymerase sigma factor [Phycisphaerae bacterium]|nr:RNA polymerase sigma factor [Phycisphaerae bacterium]
MGPERGRAPDPTVAAPGSSGAGGAARPLTRHEFAEHYQRTHRILWCIAAAVVRSPAHVEDALQDAVLVGLQKLDEFDRSTSFAAWMGQIVKYVSLNQARRQIRHRHQSEDAMAELSIRMKGHAGSQIDGRGSVHPDQSAFDDRVMGALRGLEPDARACLLLRTITGLSYREIALALAVPEGTAMSHVHRARLAMRNELGGRTAAGNGEKKEATRG